MKNFLSILFGILNNLVLEKQLAADESEALDLAFSESTRVKKLTNRMDVLLEKSEGLIPIPNPDFKLKTVIK